VETMPDAKASADLQARIGAEATMLANEQAKLSTLFQLAQSQQWANAQSLRERIVADHGQFVHRFEPTPPAP
jgi:type IV secretion system protein VirB5